MDEIKDKIKRYAELKILIKGMQAEVDSLNPLIKEYISDQNIDKLPTTLGTLSLKAVPIWKYSSKVTKLEKEVDKLKEIEKADGTATSTPRIDLMFKQN